MGTEWAYRELSGSVGWIPLEVVQAAQTGAAVGTEPTGGTARDREAYRRLKGYRQKQALPEYTPYTDDGCDLHEACLSCPLPACRYEMPPGRARALTQAAALSRLLASGLTMDEAAAELGISRRTVYRLRRLVGLDEARALRFVPEPVDWRDDTYISPPAGSVVFAQSKAAKRGSYNRIAATRRLPVDEK